MSHWNPLAPGHPDAALGIPYEPAGQWMDPKKASKWETNRKWISNCHSFGIIKNYFNTHDINFIYSYEVRSNT